jgi:hypothetical protein
MVMEHVLPERSPADLVALVDGLIAAYVTWRTECSAVTRSYSLVSACDRGHRDALFSMYVAALDREEQAATTYRRLLDELTTLETELRGGAPRPDLSALPGSAEKVAWSARSIARRLAP